MCMRTCAGEMWYKDLYLWRSKAFTVVERGLKIANNSGGKRWRAMEKHPGDGGRRSRIPTQCHENTINGALLSTESHALRKAVL